MIIIKVQHVDFTPVMFTGGGRGVEKSLATAGGVVHILYLN